MKRVDTWRLEVIILLSLIILLVSCKRDKLDKEPSGPPCQIKKIIQKMPGMEQRTGEFTYNDAGDPIDFTPQGYSTGSVKYEFRYDKDRRLTDYIGYYPSISSPSLFEFWRKFIYDDKGRIIRDTAYLYGAYGTTLTTFDRYKTVTTYEYDRQDRVNRRVWRQLVDNVPDGNMGDYKYVYNGHGNLVVPGAAYDDKVSVYRLHKLWMFLNCNYSKNNLVQAISYNHHGLPLGFGKSTQHGPKLELLSFLSFSDCQIEYACK